MSRSKLSAVATAVIACAAIAGCGTSSPATQGTSSSTAPTQTAAGATSPAPSASQEPSATGGSAAASAPSKASTTSTSATGAKAGRLPTVPSDYGQVLIDAWTAGDRVKAATVATPAAVQQIFAQQPVKGLVNYSCEDDTKPMVCGWIGDKDVRVEVTLDEAKVAEGAAQAVTKVRLAMP